MIVLSRQGVRDMVRRATGRVFAKIAGDLDQALSRRRRAAEPGKATGRTLARGEGWSVDDVICTSGPADRSFEERHTRVSIAIVAAGTFQYRSTTGRALLTPGSILLGNAGQCFECGHEHAPGDRCIAFNFFPEYFERLAADANAGSAARGFAIPRLPPLREAAGLIARASAGVLGEPSVGWEEMAVRIGALVARLATERRRERVHTSAKAVARVTDVVRAIERSSVDTLTLSHLARLAALTPYHFLRTFQQVTGATPHQYVRRTRLREAATRLVSENAKVIDVAYESGFRDVSNFNRAFRAEFDASPRAYRRSARSPTP
jgi:AraC-like DNA-binding protein